MTVYLSYFELPDREIEISLIRRRMSHNGGINGYIDNGYPCGLFKDRYEEGFRFNRITTFYGDNGSGKSTLLNLIAQKLQLRRIAPFNTGEMFDSYVEACNYMMDSDDEGIEYRIPNGSRIITSDDIFDFMLTARSNNDDIAEKKEEAREDWGKLKYGDTVKMRGIQDYEELRRQVLARSKSKSRRKFIRELVGNEVTMGSNGETALDYFDHLLGNDRLYCLDEPENSLSPKHQLELKQLIEEKAHYCGCQFIIATHSPFLLSMDPAFTTVYDLDSEPIEVRPWWELENTRLYYDFFQKNKELFCNG